MIFFLLSIFTHIEHTKLYFVIRILGNMSISDDQASVTVAM